MQKNLQNSLFFFNLWHRYNMDPMEWNTLTINQIINTMKYSHDGLIYSYVLLLLHLSC